VTLSFRFIRPNFYLDSAIFNLLHQRIGVLGLCRFTGRSGRSGSRSGARFTGHGGGRWFLDAITGHHGLFLAFIHCSSLFFLSKFLKKTSTPSASLRLYPQEAQQVTGHSAGFRRPNESSGRIFRTQRCR
jgi:hypothetical protein